jgi:hypothetical protein
MYSYLVIQTDDFSLLLEVHKYNPASSAINGMDYALYIHEYVP